MSNKDRKPQQVRTRPATDAAQKTPTAPVAQPTAPEAPQPPADDTQLDQTTDTTVDDDAGQETPPATPVDTPVQTTEPTPAPVVAEPAPEPEPEPAQTAQSFILAKYPRLTAIAPQIDHLILRLQEYEEAMGDHVPVTADVGGQHQRRLFATFKMALSMPGGLHRQGIDAVLWYFDTYRMSAFSDRLICRYTDPSRMTRQESQAFSLLCTLFRSTANPLTRRQALATTNIRLVVERLAEPVLQHNLLDYFANK